MKPQTATWSQQAWKEAEPVFRRILEHAFIRELMDGTLEQKKFLFYINQDALYLAAFGRVLSSIAARLEKPDQINAFLSFANDSMMVEKALHESFLPHTLQNHSPSPTCLLYTSFLLSQATAPAEVAVASVLPCFWVYKEVGDYILACLKSAGSVRVPKNPYQAWIDTYGGEEYAAAVARAITICDDLAAAASPDMRTRMTRNYVLATRMEWMFWDSAHRLEPWLV